MNREKQPIIVLALRSGNANDYMSTLGPTHAITASSPAGDFNFDCEVFCPELIMTPAAFIAAIERNDAYLAGLPLGECAGYDVLAFVQAKNANDVAMAIIRTRGLGPLPEHNVLMAVTIVPIN